MEWEWPRGNHWGSSAVDKLFIWAGAIFAFDRRGTCFAAECRSLVPLGSPASATVGGGEGAPQPTVTITYRGVEVEVEVLSPRRCVTGTPASSSQSRRSNSAAEGRGGLDDPGWPSSIRCVDSRSEAAEHLVKDQSSSSRPQAIIPRHQGKHAPNYLL
jgi:hypothetical protein